MSPEQREAAIGTALVVGIAIICIAGVVTYAVSRGHDGALVSLGVGVIAAIAAGFGGFRLKDFLGR